MARLNRDFFDRSTLQVASDLIGQLLVRQTAAGRLSGVVVETEAYIGEKDTACHASRGKTPRNAVMFGRPGHAYIYFTYGMHWMLNLVTQAEGFPAAVLLRAIEPVDGIEEMRRLRHVGRETAGKPALPDCHLTSGPARLCAALDIDRRLNGADVAEGEELFIERRRKKPSLEIACGPRVGIDYASPEDRQAPWRFWLKGSSFVSIRRVRSS